jgi:hypothetical protein
MNCPLIYELPPDLSGGIKEKYKHKKWVLTQMYLAKALLFY